MVQQLVIWDSTGLWMEQFELCRASLGHTCGFHRTQAEPGGLNELQMADLICDTGSLMGS